MRLSPVVQSLTEPLLSPLVSAITGASGSGFSPRSLFADGAKGVVYDNNDFVDSATWRRNLLTYSEQFDNAAWTKSAATITANTTSAPDGTTTADKLIGDSGATGNKQAFQTIQLTTGTLYTFSVYAKSSGVAGLVVSFGSTSPWSTVGDQRQATFNTSTGAVISSTGGVTASIISVGDGWYRCVVQAPITTATANAFLVARLADATGSTSFSGDGINGAFLWGAQLERASSATTYQRITDFNSDFLAAFPSTTLFLDSAGTTPATVNGLVGLQLDKSANLALGAELVTNGDFSGGTTGWVLGAGWSVSGGAATSDGLSTNTNFYTSAAILVVGRYYEVTYTLATVSAGGIQVYAGLGSGGPTRTTPGTYTDRLLCQSTTTFYIYNRSNFVGTVDNVSVKEVAGNHRYQTTTGSKPVLRGTPTGANLVTNGDFATDTVWTKGIGWTIGSGVATKTAGAAQSISQPFSPTAGNIYRVTYTITVTAGVFQPFMGGGTSVFGALRTASGTYVEYLTAAAGNNLVGITTNTTSAGTVDNVEVVDVSAGQVTAPYGLQYDGVDDFLQTAAVDFTATDKMFVCAGVRSFAVGAVGKIAELGTNAGSVAGTFCMDVDSAAGNPLAIRAFGTASGVKGENSASQPRLIVASGVLDISKTTTAEEIIIRVNGAEPAQTAFGGPLGTGNFTSNPLYFGRRAGTTQPYNGLDFGFVICGKTLTSTQIANTERWMSYRTGVTL